MSIVTGTPYTAYIYRSKELFRETLRALSENTIDLLHSDTIGIMEPLLSQTHAVKVLNHHDIESHKMDRRYRNEDNFIKRIFFRQEHRSIEKYEKENCGKYDLNIVVSDKDKERLGKICGGIEISVIENGVDCEYFSFHRRNASSRELIFTGALDYYPNAKAMLFFCGKIWPTLKRKYPELKLTIIGKNPPMQLQSFNNPEDGINMLGYIQDIRPHMKRAAVFICPILEGGGTRIKILDAFSQGVPVVSTRVGAEGLNVEDGKHIRLADTVPEFVDRVSELLEDERISNEMSSQARAFVEETYSYDIIGKKMATVYEKLLGENAR